MVGGIVCLLLAALLAVILIRAEEKGVGLLAAL